MLLNALRRPKPNPILKFVSALERLSTAPSLNEFLEGALRGSLDLAEAEVGSLFLVDEETKEFVLKRASGEYLSYFPGIRRKLDEGILGYVANRKTPILVRDVRRDDRFRNGNGFSHYRTSSFLSVPVFLHQRLMGIVNLTDKRSGRPFSKNDLEWVTLFACGIAMNFERLNLVAEVKNYDGVAEEARKAVTRLQEEKRRLEAELALSQKMASIGKLAAGIAHELNNPLDGTLRFTHLSLSHLREGNGEENVVREYLLEIKQGLSRMANIVKNLLSFSSRQRAATRAVDVNEVLEKVLANLTESLYPTGIQIIKAYHPRLPLLLDKGIDQIFTNIIKNAIEAMPNGGLLKIATLMNERGIVVRISDTGHGISKESRPYIFEPFFTTKEIDKGCGLGLAICHEIMQAYEGKIDVESEENRGTTFSILFLLKYTVPKERSLIYAR